MKLLLVEDEQKLGAAIKRGLENEGFAVDWETEADSAIAAGTAMAYDLVILDRMLPDGRDGMEVCTELRKASIESPILMLTALGEVRDRVSGLDAGADDYLVKPFDFDELLARCRALLRRPNEVLSPDMNIGSLTIRTANKQVERDGQVINLSRKEYALLEYLAIHRNSVHSKDDLIDHVWDFDADILPNTVEVFVRSIRRKLDVPKKPSVIKTVRGFGYQIGGSN